MRTVFVVLVALAAGGCAVLDSLPHPSAQEQLAAQMDAIGVSGAMKDAVLDLHGPAMEAVIAAAKPGVPR